MVYTDPAKGLIVNYAKYTFEHTARWGYITAKFCWSRTPISKTLSVQLSVNSHCPPAITLVIMVQVSKMRVVPCTSPVVRPVPAGLHFAHNRKVFGICTQQWPWPFTAGMFWQLLCCVSFEQVVICNAVITVYSHSGVCCGRSAFGVWHTIDCDSIKQCHLYITGLGQKTTDLGSEVTAMMTSLLQHYARVLQQSKENSNRTQEYRWVTKA